MEKYKLINSVTKIETICDKVTIDGFDYYVSDDLKVGDKVRLKSDINVGQVIDDINKDWRILWFKPIATNNPNIDIPKVVCNIDLTKLCYYDRRNPDFSIKEEYGYDKEEVEATGNFAKKDCACDNCFYGRSQLTEQIIKSQETHPFSEEDMVEFVDFSKSTNHKKSIYELDCLLKGKPIEASEILKLWKEQRIKTLYYVD